VSDRRKVVATENAPGAVGPYSQAVRSNGFVFTAGQIPLDPETGDMVGESIEEQTHRVLQNLRAVLEAGGSGLESVVKMTVFMTDLSVFGRMNAVYREYFPSRPPARSAVEVSALPLGAQIEMECVALVRE